MPTTKSQVSIPLPLPIHFTLLPSRIPGKSLTPLLYSLINSIPIYITLSPSHQPHLSLLPLLLSLKPPIPPLHILTSLHLTTKDYSVDLDGVAPFIDIWVPWSVGRRICEKLGVDVLLWDKRDPTKGLLSESVRDAVSWDEGNLIGHNWIPSVSHIPPSSYSLAKLIDTPFPGSSIIPDDRCISAPIDPGRRGHLIMQAENGDTSAIRKDRWAKTWEIIARWTILAWEDFLQYPSKPPADKRVQSASIGVPSLLHDLIPILGQIGRLDQSSHTSFSPTLPDLREALRFVHAPQTPGLIVHVVTSLRGLLSRVVSLKRTRPDVSPEDVRQLQVRARVNLGVIESVSTLLMSTWRIEQENSRLCAILGGGDPPPTIIIHAGSGLDTTHQSTDNSHDPSAISFHPPIRRRRKKVETASKGTLERRKMNGWHSDSLDELGRRRGGSPISSDSSLSPLQKTTRLPGTQDGQSTTASTYVRRKPTTVEAAVPPPSTYISRRSFAQELPRTAPPDGEHGREMKEDEDDQDDIRGAVNLFKLESEKWEAGWVYLGALGTLLVALGFGLT